MYRLIRFGLIVLAALMVSILVASASFASIIHVKTEGNDANDGSTWGLAKRTVQAGLDAAVSGDEVWVAAGTYVENITLKDGVGSYGGFAGTETAREQRDWTVNTSILDGNEAGSVVTAPPGTTGTTVIDGFTIRNGNGTLSGKYRYGGGIYCSGSPPTIINNTITGNRSAGGGGIYCWESAPTITNNEITGNRGYSGGGISCSYSSPAITNNTITGNSAYGNYPGGGGGIYCSLHSSPTITNNRITDNSARIGGGVMCSGSSSPLIKGNIINENQGRSRGGGIWCHDSAPIITSNTISRNTAAECGGGIYCISCSPPITNNVMTGNTAVSGAGIYCQSSSSVMVNNVITVGGASAGGGVYCYASSAKLINNTIAFNDGAYWGGGICCRGTSLPTLANNIVAFNSSGVWVQGGTPTLSSNCVFGNTEYNYFGLPDPTGMGGNISADPRFASMGYGDMHIQPDSPCVNAGDNSMVGLGWPDMEGQPRVQNGRVDIGADESDGTEWPAVTPIIVRVSPDGANANDGSSWALAKRTVQAGIDAACAAGGEVWVKAGVYNEQITLRPYAYLYGGFAGIETAREQRDWASNVTVLDGGWRNDVISVHGGHVWTAVDGFTIRNGKSGIYCRTSSPTIAHNVITGNSRAGVWCDRGCSPNISNNVIIANSACVCGAIHCYYSSPRIINNVIAGNGGGVQCEFSSPTLGNNIVAFNASGISNSQGTPDLRNNCVYGNTEYNYSGVDDPTGTLGNISTDPRLASMEYGNMHIRFDSPCVDAGDGSIVDPGSRDMDGQPRAQGAHVDIGADESDGTAWNVVPAIVRVGPHGDDASDGSSWPLAKRTVQAGIDAAWVQGGEVWVKAGVYYKRITLPAYVYLYGGFDGTETAREQRDWASNITILDGQAGGTVVTLLQAGYLLSTIDGFTIRNGSGSPGGGVYCYASSPVITHNTLTGNSTSTEGGGIHCDHRAWPQLLNNIIAFNSSGIYRSYGIPTLRHNCVYRNTEYDYSGLPDPTGMDGNISMDPVFVDLPGGDYHLAAGSPCIDTGDDSAVDPAWLDMDGEGRIYGACVDIGADELWPIFVWIDVKPGTHPNTINVGSRALIPVAVLTTEEFDATTVNPATVEFLGSGIAVRGRWGKPLFAHGDVDDDGDVDLLMHFDTQSLLLDPGATEATLTGETFNGCMIEGSDSIVVISRK